MESQHSVGWPIGRELSWIVIISEISWLEVGSRWRFYRKSCLFEKTTPYGEIFKILFQKDSPWHRSTSCVLISWNLANQKSVHSCVIYLTKKQNFGSLSRSGFCVDRAQNLPGPAADNVLRVPQISSKSLHFWWRYSRTHEHRSNVPQSVSNTRQNYSFSPSNYKLNQTFIKDCIDLGNFISESPSAALDRWRIYCLQRRSVKLGSMEFCWSLQYGSNKTL